jgi:hypothetical protein
MRRQDLGTTENARTEDQVAHMQATVEKGVCPFCKIDRSRNKELKRWNWLPFWTGWFFWRIWVNPFAYPHQPYDMVITIKRHETSITHLHWWEMAELSFILKWALQHNKRPGGGLIMRFGEPKYNAGTLAHLHIQIHFPDGEHTCVAVFCKGPNWPQILELLKAE